MFDLDDYVLEALRAGAAGFLLKTTEPAALIAAVRSCAAGDTTLGPSVDRPAGRLLRRRRRSRRPGWTGSPHASSRCCGRWRRGSRTPRSPGELFLAETTVKTHVARILAKLGVRDRVQAVVIAHRSGVATR